MAGIVKLVAILVYIVVLMLAALTGGVTAFRLEGQKGDGEPPFFFFFVSLH